MNISNRLKAKVKQYHNIIKKSFFDYWNNYLIKKNHDSGDFLNLLHYPRNAFLEYCDKNDLNKSSIGGVILEWTIFYFLNTGLSVLKKDSIASVCNNYSVRFKWKERGFKKVNIDIVIKNIKTTKLYYAFEIKTNFDDGFEKFRREEKHIYHHRQKVFKHFKYYYLALEKPNKACLKKFEKDIRTLCKREELYILKEQKNEELPGADQFLESISKSLENIK